MELQSILDTAVSAARAGAEELDAYFRQGHLETTLKGVDDFVSNADHASEAAVLGRIRQTFPDHCVLAEEGGWIEGGPASEYTWVVDPLDGTRNFTRGLPIYAVSVACLYRGKPVAGVVLDPQRDELFSAQVGGGSYRNGERIHTSDRSELAGAFLATGYPFRREEALDLYLRTFREVFSRVRGVRRCGSAALDLAWTASGVFDGFFEYCLSAWDLAAGVLLVEEAGGRVSDLDGGSRYLTGGNVVAGSDGVWHELLPLVAKQADEATIARLISEARREGEDSAPGDLGTRDLGTRDLGTRDSGTRDSVSEDLDSASVGKPGPIGAVR